MTTYIIRQTPGSRPQTVITGRDPAEFVWPEGETVETFSDEAAFKARRDELNAPFDQAAEKARADAAAAEQAWRDAVAGASSLAALKDVLLGKNLPAQAESRPK